MSLRRWILLFFVAIAPAGTALSQISADVAIGFIDDLPASRLDPALPRDSFLSWLKDLIGPPSAAVQWEMNDCGTLTGIPWADQNRDVPVCLEANVQLTNQRILGIAIYVGTEKTGLTKSPRIANIYIETDGDVAYFKSLSELQAALNPPKKK